MFTKAPLALQSPRRKRVLSRASRRSNKYHVVRGALARVRAYRPRISRDCRDFRVRENSLVRERARKKRGKRKERRDIDRLWNELDFIRSDISTFPRIQRRTCLIITTTLQGCAYSFRSRAHVIEKRTSNSSWPGVSTHPPFGRTVLNLRKILAPVDALQFRQMFLILAGPSLLFFMERCYCRGRNYRFPVCSPLLRR